MRSAEQLTGSEMFAICPIDVQLTGEYRHMSAIAVENVSRVFTLRNGRRVMALRRVSLEVAEGEFVVLLGPSGCGKTTLLRIMGQLDVATAGSVTINRTETDSAASSIGFVFQEPTLMPWRTTAENVALPLEISKYPRKQRLQRVREMLALVNLSAAENKNPQQLSGGMRQRVSIARALSHDPQVLLMDEPFGALDAQTRDMMNIELQRIWMESKKTVVFVTHSVSEAIFLADRIVMMGTNPGHIHSITNVDLPRPRTMEVKQTKEFREMAASLREQIGAVQASQPVGAGS
jgi:NitT/TauT family transport system ATP-binding protein